MNTSRRLFLSLYQDAYNQLELTLRFVMAFAIANAPFLFLANSIYLSRALFNIDLIFALCLLPGAPIIGLTLMVIFWGLESIVILSNTYYFSSPLEFVQSIIIPDEFDVKPYIDWQVISPIVLFLIAGNLVFFITRKKWNLWRPGVFICLLLVFLDMGNGSSMLSDRGILRYAINIVGSPFASLSMPILQKPGEKPSLKLNKLPIEDTVQGLINIPSWAAAHQEQGILFVIIESLGVPKDPNIRDWVKTQWLDQDLQQRFEVHSTEIPFKGSTTSGELRSLCALSGSFRLIEMAHVADCLPARLSANGWSTVGMHGFTGRFFNRVNWWPAIGLQESLFGNAPEFQNMKCGTTFRGGCDNTLISMGIKALGPKRFVYLLTLNTHLPINPLPDGTPSPPNCSSTVAMREVCDHISATTSVLRFLRKEIEMASVPPLIIVVGDHAPPFSNKMSREAFIADKVPAVVLVPR